MVMKTHWILRTMITAQVLRRRFGRRGVLLFVAVSSLLSVCFILFLVFPTHTTYKPRATVPLNVLSLPKEFLSPVHTKFPSQEYCIRRIAEDVLSFNNSGQAAAPASVQKIPDYHVSKTFSKLSCHEISSLFYQSKPTQKERNFPLAYVLQLYKGAALLVKQLQFIYAPQNVYCINIDRSSSIAFVNAVEQIVRCLPNVFITKKRVKIIYLHVSTVRAQLNCIEDLLESSVPWRYMLNLCGQDFPLYSNQGVVEALEALNGLTNSESCTVEDEYTKLRTKNVFKVKVLADKVGHDAFKWSNTGIEKGSPPHGIQMCKGSSFIAGSREFCKYAVYDNNAKDFLNWLNDTIYVDESFFVSLARHPGVPGAILGKLPEFITRGAVRWYNPGKENLCYGYWLRGICVLGLADLSWLLAPKLQNMLFTQKIDFDYNAELVDCLFVAAQNRKHHPFSRNGISWNSPEC